MRRRLTSIRLDKIAAVDQPCQEHATVAIIKRAPQRPTGDLGIFKVTFQEALQGELIESTICDELWEAFDGIYARNEAFKESLADELSEGGDGSTASAAYVASIEQLATDAVAEIKAALKDPAAEDAADTTATAMKAASTAVAKFLSKEKTMTIATKAALSAAIAKFASSGLAATIGQRDEIVKAAADLNAEDLLPAEGPLAKAAPAGNAELVRKVALLEMPADVRKHFDGLPEADQAAFIAKTPVERADIVAKATEGDPILYTTKKGREIRKSHGELAAQLARDNDELRDDLSKVSTQLTETSIEKRAAAFPNIATSVASDMLKSVDQVGADSEAGKAIMKSLKTMNRQATGLFKNLGSSEDGGEDAGGAGAIDEFNGEVEKVKAANPKLGHADAMSKVRVGNPDLFKRAFPVAAEAAEQFEEDRETD